MSMETVRIPDPDVNPTHPERKDTVSGVCEWLGKKAECGDLAESSARLSSTAIRELAGNLDEGEPVDDAVWVRDNLDRLADRWSRRNPGAKADTVRTYMSRAKSAFERYFGWKDDPKGYKFERRSPKKPANDQHDVRSKQKAPEPAAAPAAAAPPAPPPPPPPAAAPEPGMEQHRFRLGPDRYATMTHPEDLTVAEWRRWAVNTLTRCVDYDPTDSPPIISTGIVRSSS